MPRLPHHLRQLVDQFRPGPSGFERGSGAPFGNGRRSLPGASSVVGRAHGGRVDRDVPVNVTCGVRLGLDLLEKHLPRSVRRPAAMPLVDRPPRPVPIRQIPPLHARPNPVRHPVHHLPAVPPSPTTTVAYRQKWLKPLPLGIRQIASTPRSSLNESRARRTRLTVDPLCAGQQLRVQPASGTEQLDAQKSSV